MVGLFSNKRLVLKRYLEISRNSAVETCVRDRDPAKKKNSLDGERKETEHVIATNEQQEKKELGLLRKKSWKNFLTQFASHTGEIF